MPVYLPTSVVGNEQTLLTLGHGGEIMGWFYPAKDNAQNIYQCMPCVYLGAPHMGRLHWCYGDEWTRRQWYDGDSNICISELSSHALGMQLRFEDLVPDGEPVLLRRIEVRNLGSSRLVAGVFLYGDWNMGGIRTGNALIRDHQNNALVQSHREVSLAIGGSALETWQCGKAGMEWGSNALKDLDDGALNRSDLEIGDVNWSFGFNVDLHGGDSASRLAILALGANQNEAIKALKKARETSLHEYSCARREADLQWLAPGLASLNEVSGGDSLPDDLTSAYRRSLLCLPLLCGQEGAAVAAPEFDPEFISCGGYGYHWPRDGGEYVSGLMDAGYDEFTLPFFDWCARHQDASGLWHQRYFLNGQPGPNWCLPPDTLQIDQVGAVLWAFGKSRRMRSEQAQVSQSHREMIRRAADYLMSRLTERGVHGNAFDTWETFIGSFTYSNAAIHAAFMTAFEVLGDAKYQEAASRVKSGVLNHFVRLDASHEYSYLTRGLDSHGQEDATIDSASLGAIEPFGLLDLQLESDLDLALGTLRAITERLDVDWEGGRAIRRFEGDAYVGGVPACVNTLWMARCCLHVANRLRELGRNEEAASLTNRAEVYLSTVLRRATPTGLLPELMQGPTGQRWWAAPHGWAMASFVSGVLMLARARKAERKAAT